MLCLHVFFFFYHLNPCKMLLQNLRTNSVCLSSCHPPHAHVVSIVIPSLMTSKSSIDFPAFINGVACSGLRLHCSFGRLTPQNLHCGCVARSSAKSRLIRRSAHFSSSAVQTGCPPTQWHAEAALTTTSENETPTQRHQTNSQFQIVN